MEKEDSTELGMELERCFLVSVSFDLLLCSGNIIIYLFIFSSTLATLRLWRILQN
jgi:hypothetical protein